MPWEATMDAEKAPVRRSLLNVVTSVSVAEREARLTRVKDELAAETYSVPAQQLADKLMQRSDWR
jgi:hypothetical protein